MRRALIAWIALVALGGCADDGVGPRDARTPPWEGRSVPLAIGDSWTYDISVHVTWTYLDGTDARPPEHIEGAGTREIIGTETIGEREYFIERFTAAPEGGPLSTEWHRYRQDTGGLYRAALNPGIPPGEVPDGEEVFEQVRLRYPLAVGESWQLFPGDDDITLTVLSRQTLSLATGNVDAWQIRQRVTASRPENYIDYWYGSGGLVHRHRHAEIDAIDVGSGDTVHIVIDEIDELVSMDLVGMGPTRTP